MRRAEQKAKVRQASPRISERGCTSALGCSCTASDLPVLYCWDFSAVFPSVAWPFLSALLRVLSLPKCVHDVIFGMYHSFQNETKLILWFWDVIVGNTKTNPGGLELFTMHSLANLAQSDLIKKYIKKQMQGVPKIMCF